MDIYFYSACPLAFPVYFENGGYSYVNFRCNSSGRGVLLSSDDNLSKAIINSTEYKEGYVKTNDDISALLGNAPKKVVEETPVEETIQAPAEEEPKETPVAVEDDAEKNELTFPDAASAKQYLMETYDCKSSELRSLKAIKEKFAELCINVTIED